MGIIKAVKQAIGGGFADTWQEVIEPDNIGDQTVYARGVLVNRGQNKKGSDDIVSNGSIIHVYDNQFMILVDGGCIINVTSLHTCPANILEKSSERKLLYTPGANTSKTNPTAYNIII